MKIKGFESLLKKGLKRKVKITLSVLVMFLINGSIGYSVETEIKNGITVNETGSISNVDHTASKEVYGLNIGSHSSGDNRVLELDIEKVNVALNIGNTVDNRRVAIGIASRGYARIADNLVVNCEINGDYKGYVEAIAVQNAASGGGDLILGSNTKINIKAKGEYENLIAEGFSNYGGNLTTIGKESEINISASSGRIAGIRTNEGDGKIENKIFIEDDVKIKVGVTMVNSSEFNWVMGLLNYGGNEIIARDRLVLETKVTGEVGGKNLENYALQNRSAGNIKIGDGARITTELISKNNKYNTYAIGNFQKSELTIGNDAVISAKGENAGTIAAVYNTDSTVNIGNKSNISTFGKNNSTTIALWNTNNGKIILKGGTNINSNGGYAVYNTGGNVKIIDEGYTKKIQGYISSSADTAVTDILLDTEDSYFEGGSFKDNGGIFNLGLKNDAVWYISSNSTVTDFDIENGIVDMTQNHKGEAVEGKQYVKIDNTTGSGGTYILDISPEDRDQGGDKTDGIYITKADKEQKNYIQAGKTSITGLANHDFSDKKNASIIIASADKNVTFEGSKFSDISNIYDYTLSLEENVNGETEAENIWYVTGIKKDEGEVVERIETDLTLNYMNAALARLELDTIHKRLGEIRDYNSENGIWARIASGEMEHDKTSGKFKNDYNMLQVGYDKRKELEKGSVFTGFAVHKRDGKTDFRNGDGKNNNIGISLYKSYAYNDNSYTDLIVKYSHIDNDYKNYTENNQKMEADYNTWAGSISLEHGKKYMKDNWYVTPHIQMNYTYVKGVDYTMNSGVKVEQRDIKSFIGRAGIYAGHDLKNSSHFVKAGVLHEFAGEYGAKITGEDTSINKKYNGEDTWVEIGIGGQFKIGKTGTTHLYYDLEKTFGSDFETNWQASMGVRMEL